MMPLAFMNIGGQEIIWILLLVLVLFGAKKIPEFARGMGQAISEFQKAKDEFSDELHSASKTSRSLTCALDRQRPDDPADRERRGRFYRAARPDARRRARQQGLRHLR